MTADHIRNPIEVGIDLLTGHGPRDEEAAQDAAHRQQPRVTVAPKVRRLTMGDLGDALDRGWKDLGAKRTDAVILCLIYPLAGLVLAYAAAGYSLLPLVFPLASGFALIGPVVAVAFYEISRRREAGLDIRWASVFGVVHGPGWGAIVRLSLLLFGLYLLWLAAAYLIFHYTLGPELPLSISGFVNDIFTTSAGWTMIIVGVAVGFLFAVLALVIGVFSFPLLVDRNMSLSMAVGTSVRAAARNPVSVVLWGAIVAAGLVLGSLPALIGLIIVLPLLGHATWHLYRKAVEHA